LRKIVSVGVFAILVLTMLFGSEVLADRYLQFLLRGNYHLAYEMQSLRARTLYTVENMSQEFQQLSEEYGAYLFIFSTETSEIRGFTVFIFHAQFERGFIDFNVVVDDQGGIDTFLVQPTLQTGAIAEYIDTSKFDEFEITIGEDRNRLPAVITVPKEIDKYPLVILIHDSGAMDRDSTIGPNKPFRQIAWGLATQGVAVLRYDKRSFVFGERLSQASPSIETEVIEDVVNAITAVSRIPSVSSIFLAGHGLGGRVAPVIATRDSRVDGIILLATPARRELQVIIDKQKYIRSLYGEETGQQTKLLTDYLQTALDGKLPPGAPVLAATAGYYYELDRMNPIEIVRELEIPVLIVQGDADFESTVQDYIMFMNALWTRLNVYFQLLPGLDHYFMPVKDDMSTPDHYYEFRHIDSQLIDAMFSWIYIFD
jgi:dienelactone hydrolase